MNWQIGCSCFLPVASQEDLNHDEYNVILGTLENHEACICPVSICSLCARSSGSELFQPLLLEILVMYTLSVVWVPRTLLLSQRVPYICSVPVHPS